jgi:large subunit ribosomal protein L17
MRHRKNRIMLNRFTSWRKATLKSLARNLLVYESLKTTEEKARSVRPLVEKLILLAKQDTLNARRRAFQILGDHRLVSRLFKEIGPRFKDRASGFTRTYRLAPRRGDNASMAIFELTEVKKKQKKPKKEKVPLAKGVEAPSQEQAISEEPKAKTDVAVKEKPPAEKKPSRKFLGGIKNIFKKERDSL